MNFKTAIKRIIRSILFSQRKITTDHNKNRGRTKRKLSRLRAFYLKMYKELRVWDLDTHMSKETALHSHAFRSSDFRHHTSHFSSIGFIGEFLAHFQSAANSGIFFAGPLTRNCGRECLACLIIAVPMAESVIYYLPARYRALNKPESWTEHHTWADKIQNNWLKVKLKLGKVSCSPLEFKCDWKYR